MEMLAVGSSTAAPGCRVGPGCVGMAGAILPSILPSWAFSNHLPHSEGISPYQADQGD